MPAHRSASSAPPAAPAQGRGRVLSVGPPHAATADIVIVPAVRIAPRKRLRAMRTVEASRDVHLRIAAQFVQVAGRFESRIVLAKGRHRVDGKSVLGVLMLGAARGARLRVIAIGRDAEQAITVLSALFHGHPASQ